MITIRNQTFETNSSSTHSMVICTDEEYEKWSNGELFASRWCSGFKTKEDVIEECKQEYSEMFDSEGNFISDDDYDTVEDFLNDWHTEWYGLDDWVGDLESDENTYTTSSGETLKIVCRYGADY